MAYLKTRILIYLAQKAQIALQIALLLAKKVSISKEYTDFSDIFFKKSSEVPPNFLNINKHMISLELSKQQPYEPIHNLNLVEFEIFKIYIETNLANEFI